MSELDIQFGEMAEAPGIEFAELSGAIDASTVHIFQNQLEDARKRGVTRLVMDIAKIKYVNSTGLGSLVKYADTFKAGGGGIVLLRVPAKVKIVIEMLGLHEFFEMCKTEQEALQAMNVAAASAPPKAAPAPPPKPTPVPRPSSGRIAAAPGRRSAPPRPSGPRPRVKPVPKEVEPEPMEVEEIEAVPELLAPGPAAPPVVGSASFPITVTCANCSIGVEVAASGNYMCPRCSTVLYVDGQGSVNFFAPKTPMPIQMTLVSSPECTESFINFFNTMSSSLNLPKSSIDMASKGIHEVLNKIAQEAYLAKPSTYHLLFVVAPDELIVRTSDHGRMLNGADASSTFPIAAQAFDEFEITTHPKGGNLVKMVMKLK
jgi:anti-anti-sigma factor